MYATVTQEHSDLHRTVWRFYWAERLGVVLDGWRDETRETKRHKFKASHWDCTAWSRVDQRANRISEPQVPMDIAEKALEQLRAQIKFEATE